MRLFHERRFTGFINTARPLPGQMIERTRLICTGGKTLAIRFYVIKLFSTPNVPCVSALFEVNVSRDYFCGSAYRFPSRTGSTKRREPRAALHTSRVRHTVDVLSSSQTGTQFTGIRWKRLSQHRWHVIFTSWRTVFLCTALRPVTGEAAPFAPKR